jgi:WD40 repeat protein
LGLRWQRWWLFGLVAAAVLLAAVAGTVLAVAVNVATGGNSPWLPAVDAHPLWWSAGATVAVAGAGVLVWWAQRLVDRRLGELVPVEQRPESWVVDRPAEVSQVVAALCGRGGATVEITTAVHGAGGFGKTTVAKLVWADRRVLRRFGRRVYWVTLGRDVRGAAIAAKVNDLVARLDPKNAVTFTDPQQAGEHLAALLATGPPRLLILDDVWYAEQETAFPVAGRCARLLTTRIPSLIAGECAPIRVDQVTAEQARALLTAGLPPLPSLVVAGLVEKTGRWPLLLRLVNQVLVDQTATDPNAAVVARELLDRLRRSGALQLDQLTGVAERPLDVNDPRQRQRAVAATIEASIGLLTPVERVRFRELAIFAEDETVPVGLIGQLWQATGGLDVMATRALCARLAGLAVLTVTGTADGGTVSLHDVVRDFLREELGAARLVELHRALVRAVAAGLPLASSRSQGTNAVTAWWELDDPTGYLWGHLIEHFLAGGQVHDAAAVAGDLRWVTARMVRSGPAAPYADLALIDTPRCARLLRLLEQTSHLLAPTEPAHSRIDIFYGRIASDPDWGPQAAALACGRTTPALTPRWPQPDLPDPALRRVLICGSDGMFASHRDGAFAMLAAPDGSWLATAGHHGVVRIWDVATGIERAELTTSRSYGEYAMAMAPDGTWLATGSGHGSTSPNRHDGLVRIWDVATGAERAVLTGHSSPVLTMAVAPDGSWLATAGGGVLDGVVQIWDLATETERAALTGHRGEVLTVAVAPDGSWLATGSTDWRVRIWDTTSWTQRAELTGHASAVLTMVAAPDGSWLASGGYDETVRIWDTATGTERAVLATGHPRGVSVLAVAADGSWLATSGSYDGTVRIWDMATMMERAALTGHTSETFAVSVTVAPDGTWLATTSRHDRMVRIWNTATWAERAVLTGHPPGVATRTAAVAPDGSWLATAGSDLRVRIWDVPTLPTRTEFTGHTDEVYGVAVAPDSSWLASASADRTVRIWDMGTGTQRAVFTGHINAVWAVAVAPDGTWLASVSAWNLGDRGSDYRVRIWDAATGTERAALTGHTSGVLTVAVAPDGSWFATGGHDQTVRIWDVPTGTERAVLTGHTDALRAVAVAPDGAWLASASHDRTVRIWDVATGTERAVLTGHQTAVLAVAVAPDGTWLASGGRDQTVRIWDAVTGTERAVLTGHTSEVWAVAVAPDGTWLATASPDRTLRIWAVAEGRLVASMRVEEALKACVWTPDGRSVLAGGRVGLYLFDFHPGTHRPAPQPDADT